MEEMGPLASGPIWIYAGDIAAWEAMEILFQQIE